MQKIFAGLVVVALAAMAAPVNATETTYDRNLAWMQSILAGEDMNQMGVFTDGREMSLADALADAAARAGNVDLGALASGAAPSPTGSPIGDVWVYEYGAGDCAATQIAPGSPTGAAPDPQFWLYAGGIGTLATSHGYYTFIYGWTTKEYPAAYNSAGFTATGNQDFYCFGFSGVHFAFPFVDGTASFN